MKGMVKDGNKTCIDSIEKLKTNFQSLQQENAKLKEDLKQQNKSLVLLQADTRIDELENKIANLTQSEKPTKSGLKKNDSNDLT